ncbi:MAG TPA: GNAT family N-acetyltransferase [Saprospiraceae bacterium]|nr:GNAT family N-acetyltransferase [Saprospiraceae bacterium]
MIYKIDLNDSDKSKEIVSLLKASYIVEAKLIHYFDIPGLSDDEEKIRNSNETFYGFKQDGSLAGIISYKSYGQILDIHRLAVHPNHFRKGIASALLLEAEKINSNVRKIIVSTGRENLPACKFYEKLGFKKTGEKEVAKGLIISNFEKLLDRDEE